MSGYIDLTRSDTRLDLARIEREEPHCRLVGPNGNICQGFILARSPAGLALTLCDLDFHLSSTDGKNPPRITFRRTDKNLNDKPVSAGRAQRISFQKGEDGYRQFWQMIAFLYRFNELVDLGDFADTYRAATDDDIVLHLNSYDPSSRPGILAEIVDRVEIDSVELSQLLLVRARRAAVEEFRSLLTEENDYKATYRATNAAAIKGDGDEAVWHHFLSTNRWIFGLSLDLRFVEDFVDEASVGIGDTTNHGNPKSDMLGWSDYTILIELKTPNSNIFTDVKSRSSRAGTWSFSSTFIEGISQCLAQRSSWEESHNHKSVEVTDSSGHRHALDQRVFRTIDPQVIFIIGHKEREIPRASTSSDIRIKRDTLERFSRNNRNISIVTYDELYKRAYHIAHGMPPRL